MDQIKNEKEEVVSIQKYRFNSNLGIFCLYSLVCLNSLIYLVPAQKFQFHINFTNIVIVKEKL